MLFWKFLREIFLFIVLYFSKSILINFCPFVCVFVRVCVHVCVCVCVCVFVFISFQLKLKDFSLRVKDIQKKNHQADNCVKECH